MAQKKLIVKPYYKLAAAHKLFATFMKLLIMSKIEVIDKSASTYCFTNLDFLLTFAGDDILVGHNIQTFDMKFLYRDCERLFQQKLTNDYVDTLRVGDGIYGQ